MVGICVFIWMCKCDLVGQAKLECTTSLQNKTAAIFQCCYICGGIYVWGCNKGWKIHISRCFTTCFFGKWLWVLHYHQITDLLHPSNIRCRQHWIHDVDSPKREHCMTLIATKSNSKATGNTIKKKNQTVRWTNPKLMVAWVLPY